MPLKLYQRGNDQIWHYRGTIGPAGHRSRLRGSCYTTDKDIAARKIAEIEANYWKGSFDGPAAILTFGKAVELYLEAGKSPRFLSAAVARFGDTLIKDIKTGMVKQAAIDLYPDCTAATRNRQGIGPIQAVINHCAELELCSPIKVKRFPTASKVKTPVTPQWLRAFGHEAGPVLEALAWFMFLTGARIGEAVAIQWKDVNLNRGTALIRQTKTSVERIAHLPAPLVAMMAGLPRIKERPVFVYKHPDDLNRAWFGALDRARIERLTPHCCRHGFATGLLRKRVDVLTVAKLGGWKSPAVVLRTYGHALDDITLTDVLIDTPLTHDPRKVAESLLK